MPGTAELARLARDQYLEARGLRKIDPWETDKPGDAIREISQGVEYQLFREYQLRSGVARMITLLAGDDPRKCSVGDVIKAIVTNYWSVDALLLSAAQQRKSRAGYSFEHHIEYLLRTGDIPFHKQVVLEAKKRPDFVLPSRELYLADDRTRIDALVLSAKTTLRERWKQVNREVRNCVLFLATLDENVAGNAIADMAAQGIILVVPESLKTSKITEYAKHDNVIDFSTFFRNEIRAIRWPIWAAKGVV
jgi:hypothetical protein